MSKWIKRVGTGVLLTMSFALAQNQPAPAPQQQEQVAGPLAAGAETLKSQGMDMSQYEKVVLDNFENAELWEAEMPRGNGVVTLQKREGAPKSIDSQDNKYVLGAKINFFRRGSVSVSFKPPKPIVVGDIVRGLSVWVVGRAMPHTLAYSLLNRKTGKHFILRAGKISHLGWKQIQVSVPAVFEESDYNAFFKASGQQGKTGAVDTAAVEANGNGGSPAPANMDNSFTPEDRQFFDNLLSKDEVFGNISVEAMLLEVDPMSARGTYYIHFDQLEAFIDKSVKGSLESIDNQSDNW